MGLGTGNEVEVHPKPFLCGQLSYYLNSQLDYLIKRNLQTLAKTAVNAGGQHQEDIMENFRGDTYLIWSLEQA